MIEINCRHLFINRNKFQLLVLIIGSLFYTIQTSSGLYSDKKIIATLTDDNFFQNVLNKDELIISNYYKHWSPACQRFSILFKKFANDIRHWRKVVKLVSIDCAENLICYKTLKNDENDIDDDDDVRENGSKVMNFPLIQFIPPKSKDIIGSSKQMEIDTIEHLRKATINEIISNTFLANKYSLLPLMAKSVTEICYIFNDDNRKERYAILETTPSDFGAMIILDLINYKEFVSIKRFIVDYKLINSLYPYHLKLPIILEISSTCQYRLIGNNRNTNQLRHEFVHSIRNRFFIEEYENENNNNNKNVTIEDDSFKLIRYNLSYVDLHNALRYSLVHEISNRKLFNRKQVMVIKQLYLTILNYFPFDNENVKRFFKRMTGWFENKKSHLKMEKYLAAIKTSDGFLKPMESWRHCNGSRPIYRGFPCGIWILFHTMAVNEYNITKNNPNAQPMVLKTMKNYVLTFFTCAQCRNYFFNATKNLEQELVHPNSSVLWLWKIHNQLNARLSTPDHYSLNDPYYPKYQFPTKEMCQTCFNENGEYNESEVFKFLYHYYSKRSIKNIASTLALTNPLLTLLINLILLTSLYSFN